MYEVTEDFGKEVLKELACNGKVEGNNTHPKLETKKILPQFSGRFVADTA